MYTALSYVWGIASILHSITLDGSRFMVRDNLFRFLLRAQEEAETLGMLWIDAICIDQSNIAERNHQVALMGSIYSQATQVVVWLGEGHDELVEEINVFNVPSRQSAGSSKLWKPYRRFSIEYRGRVRKDHTIMTPLEQFSQHVTIRYTQWLKLEAPLSDNEYWTRAWVFQEFVLAKLLCMWCGPTKLHGELFSTRDIGSKNMFVTNERRYRFYSNVWSFRFQWQCFPKQLPIWEFFTSDFPTGCADIRDRVFAIFSMVRHPPFAVDYTRTVEDLFAALVVDFFTTRGRLRRPLDFSDFSYADASKRSVIQKLDFVNEAEQVDTIAPMIWSRCNAYLEEMWGGYDVLREDKSEKFCFSKTTVVFMESMRPNIESLVREIWYEYSTIGTVKPVQSFTQ